jgi:NADPH:quinone reductase-like Zn-dependent oxidoreductase
MRAVVWTTYGPPEGLEIRLIPRPSPRPNELLIRVRATSICAGDCELRALRFSVGLRILMRLIMGVRKPRERVLGQEFAGEVVEMGHKVTGFQVGEAVFGTTGLGFGAYAEYLCLSASSRSHAIAGKPIRMSFDESATVPTGGLEALRLLRKAGDLAGRKVLIIGAGGGIGAFAVQLAKGSGAVVTGVEAPARLDLVRALGADRVVDYTREDALARRGEYDVIFDVAGKSPFRRTLRAVRRGGTYLLANPNLSAILRSRWASLTTRKRVVYHASPPTTTDLESLRALVDSGKLRTVVDRRYPLSQVPEAHRFVDAGLARGRVVIQL